MNLQFNTGPLANIFNRYKLLFIIAGNIIIFGVVFFFLILPQFDAKEKLHKQYSDLQKEYDTLIAIKNNLDTFKRDLAKVKQQLDEALSQLPERKDIPNLLRAISNISGETQVKVRYFEPKDMKSSEFFAELPIEIRYSGSYHNMGHFFDELRKMERIVHIPVFSLEAKGPPTKIVLDGSLTARTFLYVKQQPKPQGQQQQPPKAEKK